MSCNWFGVLAAAVMLAGCDVDGDGVCGPSMRYQATLHACVCTDDAIQVEGGCQPCAADEIPTGGVCACPPGEAKDGSGVCAEVPGLGVSCDATHPCADGDYELCAGPAGATACTRACAADANCPDTYACADWEPEPYCRAFTGLGAACADTPDCAAYDAAVCIQGTCAVSGCTVGVDECPRDMTCCDLSAFGLGTVCTPPAVCPS